MLSNRDLYAEIEAIEKRMEQMPDSPEKDLLKIGTLNLKLLHNIRANMVTVMKHFNIELLKPQTKREDADGSETKEKPKPEERE